MTIKNHKATGKKVEVEIGEYRVPQVLRERDQWVCHADKVPKSVGSLRTVRSIDPTNQNNTASYAAAMQTVDQSRRDPAEEVTLDGVGFALCDQDDLVVVDLDGCVDLETGEVTSLARDIVRRCDSFTEVSQSGSGLHIFVRGSLDDDLGNRGDDIELYESGRYIAFTGRHVVGTPTTIQQRDRVVREIQRDFLSTTSESTLGRERLLSTKTSTSAVDDQRVVETAIKYSENFETLWNGDDSDYSGDTSAADMAFLNQCVFWTRGDRAQMDRLFRQSKRMRPKWDSPRGTTTWGEQQLDEALRFVSDHFSGEYVEGE